MPFPARHPIDKRVSSTPSTRPIRRLRRLAVAALSAGLCLSVLAAPAAAAGTPPTPLNILVTNVSATSVSLQWTPGYLTEPTHWRVYRNGTLAATRYGSAYTATGLTPGATYSFYVVAVHDDGAVSAPTRTVTVTTRGPGVAPGAPADPRALEVDPARVTIEFDRPDDEFDVWSYRVFDGDELVATVGKTPYAHPTAVVTVRGLAPGSTHTFTVRALRSSGLSAPSDPLVVTTPTSTDTTAPSVPTGLTGELAPYTCDWADLSWRESTDDRDAPADIDYEVLVDGTVASVVRGTGEAFSVPLRTTGAHSVAVRAVDSSGNASATSAAITLTVDPNCQP